MRYAIFFVRLRVHRETELAVKPLQVALGRNPHRTAGITEIDHPDCAPHEFAPEAAATSGQAGQNPADRRLLEPRTGRKYPGIGNDRTVSGPADQVQGNFVQSVQILIGAILLDHKHRSAGSQHCIQLPNIELIERMKPPFGRRHADFLMLGYLLFRRFSVQVPALPIRIFKKWIPMNDVSNHIRLVAGFEIRPPGDSCRFILEPEESRRLGGLVAEDLSHCVPEVTSGHLVTGPALLEPGQIISPDHAPWEAMAQVARLEGESVQAPDAGITSIGANSGQLAHAPLMPYWSPPRGLFVCLPVLLAVEAAEFDPLRSRLEQKLFEIGGLRPPAMGTLAEITGLDPVHGQLMTRADLMALLKVQFAGAGLDPFWPPVEHALLEPQSDARLELPGGLDAQWNVTAGGWELEFMPLHLAGSDGDEYALWLRALRQTTALLESHLVRWRATSRHAEVEIEPQSRWGRCDLGPTEEKGRGWMIEHRDVGLVAYTATIDGRYLAYYPLDPAALDELRDTLRAAGIADFQRSGDTTRLLPR